MDFILSIIFFLQFLFWFELNTYRSPFKNTPDSKVRFFYVWHWENVVHVLVCLFSNLSKQKRKNIAVHFIGTIVPIKCMPKISAVGLFCLDKFENNQTRMCTTFFRTSKLTELYFSRASISILLYVTNVKKWYLKK